MPAAYLQQVIDTVKLVLNKERKGSIKDSQILTALRIGQWNFYDRQLMILRSGGEIPSSLRSFEKTASVTITAGVGATPTDFVKEISFTSATGATKFEGEFLPTPEYDDRLRSAILIPTLNDPIAKIEGTVITVNPTDTSINLTYLRKPIDPVLTQTIDADGRGTTVNLATSTDLDFPQEYYPDIIKESLVWIGIKQQDQEVTQLGTSVKQ